MINNYLRVTILVMSFTLFACGGSDPSNEQGNPIVTPPMPTIVLPRIIDVKQVSTELRKYDLIEYLVELDATYLNPYDSRQVDLSSNFRGPSGQDMKVPGFWDGNGNWRIRFAAPEAGQWNMDVTVSDSRGVSQQFSQSFVVLESQLAGWLLPGNLVNPDYSARYLAYHDGTPFYGVGHADAFAIGSFSQLEAEINSLVSQMKQADENYVIYWPSFSFSIVRNTFSDYQGFSTQALDMIVETMRQNQLHIIYTLWDHSYLRDDSHPWGDARWHRNGFSDLTSAVDFFVNEEAWQWQKNFYRYHIARWGYSSSIGMWQTVSEVDGTDAFENTDTWHQRVNQYFVEHDPYRHPTTASLSGDKAWITGFEVMDVPQVHIYNDLLDEQNPARGKTIQTAEVIANYTRDMWNAQAKPNWVGEFGVLNDGPFDNHYPELFHNAIWAGLVSGAALTPAEWNDDNRWQVMTPEMQTHMQYFHRFVRDIPLVIWAPQPISVFSQGEDFKGWGLTSDTGTIVWGLDTQHQGLSIDDIRQLRGLRQGIQMSLVGMAEGRYRVTPYNTWTGQWLEAFDVDCAAESSCQIELPDFRSDIALKILPHN